MSDYTKSTNFASKDSLAIGNPLKIVKGTEIDAEFNNIATAVATKADLADPTFTGIPAAPTASPGTSTTQLATTAFVGDAINNYDTALTVSTSQLENLAVTSAKLADDSVTEAKLAVTGTASSSVFLRGDMAWAAPSSDFFSAYQQEVDTYLFGTGFTITDTQTYSTPGTVTWTKPAGTWVLVEIWGAGGSGGRNTYAGGGGGGGYSSFVVPASSLPSTVSVTVGAGGAAVSSNGNGNAGGSSSFGAFCTATGGAAGLGQTTATATVAVAGGSGGAASLTSVQSFSAYVNRVVSNTLGSLFPATPKSNSVGGGSGGGDDGSGFSAVGQPSTYGGGGGGYRASATIVAAGTSTYGGSGGAASTTTGTAGTAPGGGGGGGGTTSGAGANGRVVVRTMTRP